LFVYTGRKTGGCVASNRLGISPDDLGIVAPFVKIGHVRRVVTIRRGEQFHLAIVPHVGDNL